MAETVASRILSTLDNDILFGTPGDDVIDALAGNAQPGEPPQKPQKAIYLSETWW